MKTKTAGLVSGLASYIFWGLSPIYWKLFSDVSGFEVISHRIIWSFVFLFIIILIQQRFGEILSVFKNPETFGLLFLSSIVISFNWGVYIITVNSGHVLEASLGYYINPFVSMLVGILFFKERLSSLQYLAIFFAALGVSVFAIGLNSFPWASITLAVTFAAYGAIRKHVKVMPMPGLLAETALMLPFVLAYLTFIEVKGLSVFSHFTNSYDLLFVASGIITSLPLIGFAFSVKRLRLITVGVLQFTAPTVNLLLGVFVYNEAFSMAHFFAFALIWICITIFTLDSLFITGKQNKVAV